MQAMAAEDDMIRYLDCGTPFLVPGNVSRALLPDELHPNTAGYRLLAACIAPVLGPLVQGAPAAPCSRHQFGQNRTCC